MTINEYQQLALRTEAPKTIGGPAEKALLIFAMLGVVSNPNENISLVRLLEGSMGMCGESGEVDDILKKTLFQGHTLDREHVAKELGDVAWYLALSADAIGYTLEEILQMNINKLENRYPDGFDRELSIHRQEGDI